MSRVIPTTLDEAALEIFAGIRLIALDIDGTLLASSMKEISSVTEYIKSLLERYGIHVTLATGRTYNSVEPLLESVGPIRRVPIILYNGAVIVAGDGPTLIQSFHIPVDVLREVVQVTQNWPVNVLAYCLSEQFLSPAQEPITETVYGWGQLERSEHEFNGLPVRWQDDLTCELIPKPCSITVVGKGLEDPDEIVDRLREITNVSLLVTSTYIEVNPPNANKKTALERIANLLQIHPSQILAIGDDTNDSEMLEWAGLGVAVQNASKAAIDSANFVTRRPGPKGVIECMRLVKEAKRINQNTKR